MPVDPHRITEVAQRLSTRLEATYSDLPDAEVESVLVVAAGQARGFGTTRHALRHQRDAGLRGEGAAGGGRRPPGRQPTWS
jgi:hypothetical protein